MTQPDAPPSPSAPEQTPGVIGREDFSVGSGPMRGPAWSSARRERRTRLAEASKDLADLYEVAIDLLGAPDAAARMLLLGHCMREISNRLPDILYPDLPSRSLQDKAVEELAGVWRTADVKIETAAGATANAPIAVPRYVAVRVEELVTAFESGQGANYAKAAFLVTGTVPNDLLGAAKSPDPAVSAFLKTKDYFMRNTHAGIKDRKKADQGELEDRMAHLEHVLDVRLGDWWEARQKVREMLALANAHVTDSGQIRAAADSSTQKAEGQDAS